MPLYNRNRNNPGLERLPGNTSDAPPDDLSDDRESGIEAAGEYIFRVPKPRKSSSYSGSGMRDNSMTLG